MSANLPAVVKDGLWPTERWERVQGEESLRVLANETFERLTDAERPETLEEIAKSRGYPRGAFVRWFTTKHQELFDAALKVLGSGMGAAVKRMTDETTVETLGLMKFKTDRYLRLAGHLDPERYSPRTEVKHSGLVPTLVIEIAAVPGATRIERVVVGEQLAVPVTHDMI